MIDKETLKQLKEAGICIPEDAVTNDADNTTMFLEMILKTCEKELSSTLSDEEKIKTRELVEECITQIKREKKAQN